MLLVLLGPLAAGAEIERIWLTHQTHDPGRLVVNWETDEPGDSAVEFGMAATLGERVAREESVTCTTWRFHSRERT
ncbi:MAG: hypothetical protein QOE70_3314 [Chthoniobacter sp.]|nr:hypothetical protein [Chthoniobacter sp.]